MILNIIWARELLISTKQKEKNRDLNSEPFGEEFLKVMVIKE